MDEQYSKYTSALETFIRDNHSYMGSLQKNPNSEMYLEYFKSKEAKKGKSLVTVSPANLYDDQLIARYHKKIIYFSHFVCPDNIRKFCALFQFEENLHGFCAYGFINDCGFVASLEYHTSEPAKVIEFLDKNKDIEFKKDYNKSLGFGSFKPI